MSGGTNADPLRSRRPPLTLAARSPSRVSPRTEDQWLKALPWLNHRRCPATIFGAPKSSRASRSCSRARTPPPLWRRARPAAARSTPPWLSWTPASRTPSIEWRREYSLILGLERLLSDEEPKLADGTTLSAHQVDALSGTLIALTAEVQSAAERNGNRVTAPAQEPLGRGRDRGRRGALRRGGAARLGRGGGGRGGGAAADAAARGSRRHPALLVRARHRRRQDRGRARLRRGLAAPAAS